MFELLDSTGSKIPSATFDVALVNFFIGFAICREITKAKSILIKKTAEKVIIK